VRGLRSVESVEPPANPGGAWRLHVRPVGEEGRVRQDILLAAVEQGLRLTSLRPIVPSLDDIYRVAVERPLPKRGVKVKGKRRREAMAAAASAAAGAATIEPAESTEALEPIDPSAEAAELETTESTEEDEA
jgi:hypothetical protein